VMFPILDIPQLICDKPSSANRKFGYALMVVSINPIIHQSTHTMILSRHDSVSFVLIGGLAWLPAESLRYRPQIT